MAPTLCNSGAATMADLVRESAELAVAADRATSRKVYESLANQYGFKPVVAA
jgi:predicted dinucleotide-binding enzyme